MTNILRIFVSDFKRIWTNVVAVVVIIGLSVIPSLYAWFNILSNWAPYEKEATSQLSVAVATSDRGTEIEGMEINLGQVVVDNLKSNDSIHWEFYDTSYEAIKTVESGDCYAALVVDVTFTEDMMSFISGNLNNPRISYYENEKKNAIAPKITGKVKTTVQEEVNKAFVSTLAEALLRASAYVTAPDTDSSGTVTDSAIGRMRTLDSDLSVSISMMNSYISLMDAAGSLMDAAKSVTEEVDYIEDNSRAMMDAAEVATDAAKDSTVTIGEMADMSMVDLDSLLVSLERILDASAKAMDDTGALTKKQAETLKTAILSACTAYMNVSGNMKGKYTKEVDEKIDLVTTYFVELYNTADELENVSQNSSKETKKLLKTTKSNVAECRKDIKQLKKSYHNAVSPQLDKTFAEVESSLREVESLLNHGNSGIHRLSGLLESYPDLLGLGKDQLINTRDEIVSMQKDLEKLIADMEDMQQNDQYQMLLKLVETDPQIISDFVSSPVDLQQESLYAIENNGSATAPFYIILSIWVGALIMVAIIHTKVKPIEGVTNLKTYEEFFGRYLVFFLVGQLQTLITVLGAQFFVGIQCQHRFLFWLACSVTSFAFTLLLYALTYAFEAVGEAIAVVLMVLQVAGSGGTFPVEVLPKLYQVMYGYMPFAYGMNAARECIAGMFRSDYWMYLSGLLVYVAVALFIGLVISIPCKKMNLMIKESTEKTDLLL